ncbi:Adenosine 5'-monophosphoramidase [Naganishia albida]|nr:Adenosine 5'-monophosphoramidase [Naganishia albida]
MSSSSLANFKLLESETALAFMDVGPIAKGHCLVIPKHHARTLTDLPDEEMKDILPFTKKLARVAGGENWNLLQNNGRWAHQVVDHVHFHMIPKPVQDKSAGLGIEWPSQDMKMDDVKAVYEELKAKLE